MPAGEGNIDKFCVWEFSRFDAEYAHPLHTLTGFYVVPVKAGRAAAVATNAPVGIEVEPEWQGDTSF